MDVLACTEVNVANSRGAGLRGDLKDDGNVAWEGAAKWRRG